MLFVHVRLVFVAFLFLLNYLSLVYCYECQISVLDSPNTTWNFDEWIAWSESHRFYRINWDMISSKYID